MMFTGSLRALRLSPFAFSLALIWSLAARADQIDRPVARPVATPTPAPVAASAPPADRSYNNIGEAARTPEEQRATFVVPEGFEIELVAAETEGGGKFITVTWDARMRLWTMTALEYPVDGNEQKSTSDALFARGGRDRVLVYDSPYGVPEPGKAAASSPRVFADGLVMPLGLQPYRDGAFVQYGTDIRFYRDTTGDGKADGHTVVLTGFGTEDSHLFPHQFLRQPGGWLFVAQGAFNYSKVRRPDGKPFADGSMEVIFNQCKLGRMQLDGSQWENLTAGPNNIWGLVTSREGETFMQEANDMGYPVIPYQPGVYVPTLSRERLRPYQPLMPPPLEKPVMGGTGLSGLALAEDGDGRFHQVGGDGASQVFYLANPITGTIQVVRTLKEPGEDGHGRYEKRADFISSSDRWFRPIAVHFGPDGALYIVDWYNRIISHNEVPREHPDRDRSRGRIWRVRHRDQTRVTPPDLTRLDDRAVLAQVDNPNALVSRLAWLELTDRRATSLVPDLRALAADRTAPTERRLAALWVLESLQPIGSDLLRTLANDPSFHLRREAIRLAGVERGLKETELATLAGPIVDDPHPAVRAALGDALRRVKPAGTTTMMLAARLARASLVNGAVWSTYEREFERYLARWAMETNPVATRTLLTTAAGQALPLENQVVALLALGDRGAALTLAARLAELGRAPAEEEVRLLLTFSAEAAPRQALLAALESPARRQPVLKALIKFRSEVDPARFQSALTEPVLALLASTRPDDRILGAEIAGAFQVNPASELLVGALGESLDPTTASLTPVGVAALRALRVLRAAPPELLQKIASHSGEREPRNEAIAALAEMPSPDAAGRLVSLLSRLSMAERGRALEKLSANPVGIRAVLAGVRNGQVAENDLGYVTVERMRTVLPDNPEVILWWNRVGGETLANGSGETGIPVTAAEAAAQAETFALYRRMANWNGNPEQGRVLFEALCLVCHVQGGKGGQIGPALDGLGHTGIDAILRNLLTPSAAMESAYRTYRVITRDGNVVEGFLAGEDAGSLTLRIPGSGERRLARTDIREGGYLRRSLMPSGLLEGLPTDQARDLLGYLKSLR